MFMSRLTLDPTDHAAQWMLASPYRLHAAIEGCFPAGRTRSNDQGRILWRVDEPRGGTGPQVYLVSPDHPVLDGLVDQLGGPEHVTCQTKDYDHLLASIREGGRYAFRLRANPVRRISGHHQAGQDRYQPGQLVAHITPDHQLQWLVERSAAHGFTLDTASDDPNTPACLVSHRRTDRFRRRDAKVTLATVQYDGLLIVTDADAFRHCLGHGLGRSKGFGCGLMTVVPVRTTGET